MAIITLEQWKTLTGTTSTDYDTLVTTLIPYVQADFVDMCNFDFYQDTDDEEWPDGCELYVAKMISYQISELGSDGEKLKSESIDGYSYTRSESKNSVYPLALENTITARWRYCGFKSGTEQLQYRDKRGFSPERLVNE